MSDVLQGINEISGVIGSAVFDGEGNCIAHLCPRPFEPILLSQVMGELQTTFSYLNYLDEGVPWDMFTADFSNGSIVVRKVEDMSILALGSKTLNASMLAIAFNVAALKLQKRAAGSNMSVSSQRVSMPMGSVSALTSPSSAGGKVRPPNAVDTDLLNKIVRLLAAQVGPFSKVFLKEELAKMGVTTHTVVNPQLDDLIGALARRIQDPAGRRQFQLAVEKIRSGAA